MQQLRRHARTEGPQPKQLPSNARELLTATDGTTLTKICELLEAAEPVPKKSDHLQKNADDADVEMTDADGTDSGGDDKSISSADLHAPRLVPSGCILFTRCTHDYCGRDFNVEDTVFRKIGVTFTKCCDTCHQTQVLAGRMQVLADCRLTRCRRLHLRRSLPLRAAAQLARDSGYCDCERTQLDSMAGGGDQHYCWLMPRLPQVGGHPAHACDASHSTSCAQHGPQTGIPTTPPVPPTKLAASTAPPKRSPQPPAYDSRPSQPPCPARPANLTAGFTGLGRGAHATDLAALDQFIEQAAVRIQRAFRRFTRQRSSCPGIIVARPHWQPPTVCIQPKGDTDSLPDSSVADTEASQASTLRTRVSAPCMPGLHPLISLPSASSQVGSHRL